MDYQSVLTHADGCGCDACGYSDEGFSVVDANVDGTGGSIAGKTVYTIEQVIANMNRTSYPGSGIGGPGWSNEGFDARPSSGDPLVIRFGFHTSTTMFAEPYVYRNAAGNLVARSEYFGFAAFSDAQMAAARKSIALWDDLIQVTFVETTADQADITYGNITNSPNTQAYAYLPYNYTAPQTELAGDVWVNPNQISNLQLGNGYYGLATLIHETGHALGLQHPGGYNAAPGVSITYAANAEYYQDTRQYSQMSYFNAEFSGAGHIDWNRVTWVYGQTPLLHDIAVIQAMYGADPTTRTGDTIYGFNSNAGRDVYDFAANGLPVISIYDAGGIDTLDFSGWDTGSEIDLNPGAFSSGGGSGVVPLEVLKARGLLPSTYTEAQYEALRARYNSPDGMLKDNISIAYGTTIENAIGGEGADTIFGNGVANQLEGRGGSDLIRGRAGNDILDGGTGNDSLFGDDGDDRLLGGEGNDRLVGGNGLDRMTGGIGNDVFVAQLGTKSVSGKNGLISLDVVMDFMSGQDLIDLSGIDANASVEGHQAFSFIGTNALKTAGQLSYKVFDSVNGAERALGYDIDGVDGDSPYAGPVTLLFGDVDGGGADFAMAFMNTGGLNADNFLFA